MKSVDQTDEAEKMYVCISNNLCKIIFLVGLTGNVYLQISMKSLSIE